jgi:hypothetical protein
MSVGVARRGMRKPRAPPPIWWCDAQGGRNRSPSFHRSRGPANHRGPPPPLHANPDMEPSSCSPTSYLRVAYLRLEFRARERWMGGLAMASAAWAWWRRHGLGQWGRNHAHRWIHDRWLRLERGKQFVKSICTLDLWLRGHHLPIPLRSGPFAKEPLFFGIFNPHSGEVLK